MLSQHDIHKAISWIERDFTLGYLQGWDGTFVNLHEFVDANQYLEEVFYREGLEDANRLSEVLEKFFTSQTKQCGYCAEWFWVGEKEDLEGFDADSGEWLCEDDRTYEAWVERQVSSVLACMD